MEGARGILSCTSCRQRKLKCDREEPCSNCTTRNFECTYVSHGRNRGRGQRREKDHQLGARISHLERLISNLAARSSETGEVLLSDSELQRGRDRRTSSSGSNSSFPKQAAHTNATLVASFENRPGQIISNTSQTIYVSDTHWAAICSEAAEIREHLDQGDVTDDAESDDLIDCSGPMLLEGIRTGSGIQDVLPMIPTKDVASRLVSRYFNSSELSIVLLHAPTFEREYQRFWLHPQDVPTPWLGLLFGVLAVGTFLYMRAQEELPGAMGPHGKNMELFQRCSTECLILSDYASAPGPYTIEALMFNIQNEFIRRRDAHLGVWVLAGIAIRLAMRMGYHRDPKGHPQFSAFQGEMRRRVWACIIQLDVLTSYQIGLPPMIHESQCDTRLPRNLLDEDFGPDVGQLPTSRSETELTPILYTLTKARISTIFRAIINEVSISRTDAYDKITALDQRLRSARLSMSPRLQMASIQDSITVSAYLLIRRFSLELFCQKAMCILHRNHMTKSFQDPKYLMSRSACVEAAMTILAYQADLVKEVQPGGLLHRSRWIVSSLEQADTLLASMVVCLELSFRARQQPSWARDGRQHASPNFSQQDLVKTLQNSQSLLKELKTSSRKCKQAYEILSLMLRKFSESAAARSASAALFDVPTLSTSGDNMNGGLASTNQGITQLSSPEIAQLLPTSPTMHDLASFFDAPDAVNWDLWEEFVQSSFDTDQFHNL